MLTPGSLLLTGLVAVLFCGSRRLRDLGSDLGAAVRNFREGLSGSAAVPVENGDKTSTTHHD